MHTVVTACSFPERDIFAGIPREWNLDSVQSRGTVGNGFHADGNGLLAVVVAHGWYGFVV